jgi:hypothetical protein
MCTRTLVCFTLTVLTTVLGYSNEALSPGRVTNQQAGPQPIDPLALSQNANSESAKVTTLPVPDRGRPVAAKVDSDGAIHLLFDSANGPQYAKSTDGGLSFGAAVPVVDRASRKPGLEFYGSDMAVGKAGRVHVAMSTNAWKLKLPEEEWGFMYADLEPEAAAFSPIRNLNKRPSEGFSLAADTNGNVTACWLCDKLFANVSHDGGKTFAPTVEINPLFDPCNCCTTSAEYGADGRLAVLYREETHNERDMYVVLWDQAHGRTSRTRVSSTPWKIDACPMTYYAISRYRGGFVAVWPTKDRIYFARLDSKGNPLPPEETKTPGSAGMRTGMLALSAPDGSNLMAWTKNQQIGWQVYDPEGKPVGAAGSAKSSGNGVAGVVAKDGHYVLFR